MKRSVPGPTETQYEWAVQKFNELTDELNAIGYMGGNLKTYQVQANWLDSYCKGFTN